MVIDEPGPKPGFSFLDPYLTPCQPDPFELCNDFYEHFLVQNKMTDRALNGALFFWSKMGGNMKYGVAFWLLFACSSPLKNYNSFLTASEGCRDIHSCSSCSKTEKCNVTERNPEGWATKRECCPK